MSPCLDYQCIVVIRSKWVIFIRTDKDRWLSDSLLTFSILVTLMIEAICALTNMVSTGNKVEHYVIIRKLLD
jgi:hypothetical protein